MDSGMERRREARLQYSWPVWFAEDFDNILTQGQMVDVSSGGAAFTCYADRCPSHGERITTRFSVPQFDDEDSYDMANFIRDGHICRVDELGPYIRRVAVQFADPLPFAPAANKNEDRLVHI
jgi:hypothetical protein